MSDTDTPPGVRLAIIVGLAAASWAVVGVAAWAAWKWWSA
jgi:hypothetical protein